MEFLVWTYPESNHCFQSCGLLEAMCKFGQIRFLFLLHMPPVCLYAIVATQSRTDFKASQNKFHSSSQGTINFLSLNFKYRCNLQINLQNNLFNVGLSKLLHVHKSIELIPKMDALLCFPIYMRLLFLRLSFALGIDNTAAGF